MTRAISFEFDTVAPWVSDKVDCDIPRVGAAIGLHRGDELVAGVLYEHFTGASITVTIAIAPGANISKEFLSVIFRYPFEQLGVNRLIAYVEDSNEKAMLFNEHLGFELETIIRGMFPGGDALVYSMTREQCRWLDHPQLHH